MKNDDVGARIQTDQTRDSLTASTADDFRAHFIGWLTSGSVAPARRVSAYLLAVMDVSNAAHDHKALREHNCNVSISGLRRAAQFLAALVDDRDRDEAERIVNAMPRC